MKKINNIYVFLFILIFSGYSCTRQKGRDNVRPVQRIDSRSVGFQPAQQPGQKEIKGDFSYSATFFPEDEKDVTGEIKIPPLVKKSGTLHDFSGNFSPENPVYSTARRPKPMPVIFQINFDNDIFDETDYYYTNGVRLSLTTPLAQNSPLYKILLRPKKASLLFTGFSLRQNMYTPTDPDVTVILKGDHPFAGYMVFGQFNHAVDFRRRLNLFSEINLGVIGPASLAGSVQYTLHEKKPEGWINQIRNDIIVNYTVSIEKPVLSTPHAELNLTAAARAGTLYDDAGAGLFFRTGSFMSVYRGIWKNRRENRRQQLQYWFFMRGNVRGVLYNATLQGGMFSKSPYTIPAADINRAVVTASAGLAVYYRFMGLELENFYQTPPFKGAYDFRWGRIKLSFLF